MTRTTLPGANSGPKSGTVLGGRGLGFGAAPRAVVVPFGASAVAGRLGVPAPVPVAPLVPVAPRAVLGFGALGVAAAVGWSAPAAVFALGFAPRSNGNVLGFGGPLSRAAFGLVMRLGRPLDFAGVPDGVGAASAPGVVVVGSFMVFSGGSHPCALAKSNRG